jgi:hypothetical protein
LSPSGVSSKNQAKSSQNGKPMAPPITTQRVIQSGALNTGPSEAMTLRKRPKPADIECAGSQHVAAAQFSENDATFK